jgi:hypothetical protein
MWLSLWTYWIALIGMDPTEAATVDVIGGREGAAAAR